MTERAKPRLIPMVIVCLAVVAGLKLLGAFVAFSGAEAQSAISVTPAGLPIDEPLESPEIAPAEVERRILERLAARRAELEQREREFELRESVIAAAEAKLAQQFEEFEKERAEIAALREERDAASAEEIEALVSAYERMKPREAAAIFNDLDATILLSVASQMRTQALAGVLAEMQPVKARALTVMMAERGQAPVTLQEVAQ